MPHMPQPQPHRVAFVLIDGVGDVSIPSLGFRTPLEASNTPVLDAIAAAGYNGLVDPVEPGLACGSDTAHMALFGYEPRRLYRGRGAYESMGAGLAMSPGDIAFKCNFATLDTATGIVVHRRADRRFEEEGPILCAALDGRDVPGYPGHSISVRYATEHRCGVVIRGPGLTDAVKGTDPLKDNLPLAAAAPADATPEAAHTAAVVNAVDQMIREILENHPINEERRQQGKNPANVVLLRGCGCRLALPPFQTLHGMRPCIVSPTKIIAGLGMCADMHVLNVPGTTGDYRTMFHRKAEAVASALAGGTADFAFLHVKAVDDAGHDREVGLRVKYLEVVDRMVGQLLRLLWEAETASGAGGDGGGEREGQKFTVVITGDHSTPVEFGDHSNEPVPFAIAALRDAVAALGGTAAVAEIPLGPIPHPKSDDPEGRTDDIYEEMEPDSVLPALEALNGGFLGANGGTNGASHTAEGPCFGDSVRRFTEFDAAQGSLGRFPGHQVMGLVKALAGVAPQEAAAA